MQVLKNGGMAGVSQSTVIGANGMLGGSALQDNSWPYFWGQPGPNTQWIPAVQTIPAPAPATLTEVVEFPVPSGFRFILYGILQTYQTQGGSPFIDGSGDILWTVDADKPIGSNALSAYALPYLKNMQEHRGSLDFGPWEIKGYMVFEPYQVIRYKVLTTVNIAQGLPNTITCGLFGWLDKAL